MPVRATLTGEEGEEGSKAHDPSAAAAAAAVEYDCVQASTTAATAASPTGKVEWDTRPTAAWSLQWA